MKIHTYLPVVLLVGILAVMCGCTAVAGAAIRHAVVTRNTSESYVIPKGNSEVFEGVLGVLSDDGAVERADESAKQLVGLDSKKLWRNTTTIHPGESIESSVIDVKIELVGDWEAVQMTSTKDRLKLFLASLREKLGGATPEPTKKGG